MSRVENPIFKLEKVLRSKSEELQDFEGPLDLILFLLSKNKMEIQDIAIAVICDQYLEWLHQRQEMDLEVASEFVAMASHLVYLKTKMLLSMEDEETQSEVDALIQSLEERRRSEEYQRIRTMALALLPRSEFGRDIVTRDPEPAERGKVFVYSHTPEDLVRAMRAMRSRQERALPPPTAAFQEIVGYEPYPVLDKAMEILGKLRQFGTMTFRKLFRGNRTRSEAVATFLAVLELCKARIISLNGSETDCTVRQEQEAPEDLNF